MEFYEKTIKEDTLYEGKIIKLTKQQVKLPNGLTSIREIVKHPGGVAIIAFKDKDTILLVEQFRKPLDKVLLELPAGKIEKNEDIEICAKRELEEETGYRAKEFKYLGKIATTPGFSNEYIYFYKAENLYEGVKGGDEDEFINVREMKIEDIKAHIKSGKIIDGKTIAALSYL